MQRIVLCSLLLLLGVAQHAHAQCERNETAMDPTTVALDARTATFDGTTWTAIFAKVPAHWTAISLTSPSDCSGTQAAWTCTPSVADPSCNVTLTCVSSGWQPLDTCNKTTRADGTLVYNMAPVFAATVPVADGNNLNSRNYEQIVVLQIEYQVYINASATFDGLGLAYTNYFISRSAVVGFNANAVLNLAVSTTVSWPYTFSIKGGLNAPSFTQGNLEFNVVPAIASSTCTNSPNTPCTQVVSFTVKASIPTACNLNGRVSMVLVQECRPDVVGTTACSLPVTESERETSVTVDFTTASVCITTTLSVTLSQTPRILSTWNSADGTGTVATDFLPFQTVIFETTVTAGNQFVQLVTPMECILDGTGATGTGRKHKYPPPAADNLEMTVLAHTTATKNKKAMSFRADPVAWGIPDGTRRTMRISCQYSVVVKGTATRRRLLQIGSGATGTSAGPFSQAQFNIAPSSSSPSAGTSSSSALAASPTVVAAAVLAVAAAVMVLVAVRRRRNAQQNMSKQDAQMVNLSLSTTSSSAALQTQA